MDSKYHVIYFVLLLSITFIYSCSKNSEDETPKPECFFQLEGSWEVEIYDYEKDSLVFDDLTLTFTNNPPISCTTATIINPGPGGGECKVEGFFAYDDKKVPINGSPIYFEFRFIGWAVLGTTPNSEHAFFPSSTKVVFFPLYANSCGISGYLHFGEADIDQYEFKSK